MKSPHEKNDMWSSFKELNDFLEDVVSQTVHGVVKQLEEILRNHKHDFLTLLSNPPKNARDREEIEKALRDCSVLPGFRRYLLTKEIVAETLILSDMFDLNEYAALDLLIADGVISAQQQMPHHPGLARGLVAVLLYYDGRRCLVSALKILVQARKGVSWTLGTSPEIVRYITQFTDDLVDQRLLARVIDLLETLDLTKELDLLHQNRAIGGPRHHRHVVDMYKGIRQSLAEVIFCWSAQNGLPKPTTEKLITYLQSVKLEDEASGIMDNVNVTLTVALLYAVDLSVALTKDAGEEMVKTLPLVTDQDFIPALVKEFLPSEKRWATPGLQGLMQLALALALYTFRLLNLDNTYAITDEDDILAESANELNVFDFMRRSLLPNQLFYKEEYFVRRIHVLLTDFIILLPMKVKEMKNRSDESSRTIQAYIQEGLEPPQGLPHHFEHFLLTLAYLYKEDPLKLELMVDYWAPAECHPIEGVSVRDLPRQIALYKFVRQGADMLPPSLYVPYMKMLQSLSSSKRSAQRAFTFLKTNGGGSSIVSWNHFFRSLERYHCNLRQELPVASDTIYQRRSFARGILPQEVQGLQAVLGVIRVVAENDPASRMNLTDWSPVVIFLGLVACAVPIPLKADLLYTLAAFARSPGLATAMWYNLEASQILTTLPSTNVYVPRGVQTELEEVESRNEEYPLTRALLYLLDVLTEAPLPRFLGVENRQPGFDPYLHFIVNNVFLPFSTRCYKNPAEKWMVAEGCLKIMKKFLKHYTPMLGDFCLQRVELLNGDTTVINSSPAYTIMINMNSKSELLRLVLNLVHEGANTFEEFTELSGQGVFEAAMLSCLQLLEYALALQDEFCTLLSARGNAVLITGLRRLLLDVNPRSGKPDHLLNVTKYVTLSSLLPQHALSAVRILEYVCCTYTAQNHILSLYTSSPELTVYIRHGFVECIEAEEEDELPGGEAGVTVQSAAKQAIFKLLQQSLPQPAPNISHYLFGFDLKDVRSTVFQQPGALGFPRTCLHSLLALLDGSLAKEERPIGSCPLRPVLDTAYCLLYVLCSNKMTCGPVLRFLRSTGDFVYRHLCHLPFIGPNKTSDMVKMSWILKVAAVEVKSAAHSDQISVLSNLVTLLTQELGDAPEDPDNREAGEDPYENLGQYLSRQNGYDDLKTKKQRLLLTLLNILDFQVAISPQPEWEFFSPQQLEVLSTQCETKGPGSQKYIDVKKMHHIILEELYNVQGNSSVHRTLVMEEIEKVLLFFVQQNRERAHTEATVWYMEAWCQVTEILVCLCPRSVLPEDVRLGLLVDSLHVLLKKILSHQVIPELGNLASGAVLLLSVALQQSLMACQQQGLAVGTGGDAGDASSVSHGSLSGSLPIYTTLNVPGRPGVFDSVLSNILEWVVNSGVSSQKLRTNLYGALLMFVRMVCRDTTQRKDDAIGGEVVTRSKLSLPLYDSPGPEVQMRRQACLEVIMGFGEGLVDVLCHDCSGSHDVCKMLALSCLGLLIEFDPQKNWITYINSRGYLRHLIDSLAESDDQLVTSLVLHPRTLSAVYVYESKMAMLCRVAANFTGAELLLEQGVFGCLARMTVFDKHPDYKPDLSSGEGCFMPTARTCYQQILFPALDLCDAILTTLGPDHLTGCGQVQYFLFSHYQMLSIVLHCGSPLLQTKFLKEVARITGIIARVSHVDVKQKIFENMELPLGKYHCAHVQTWMLELLHHFLLSENLVKELKGIPLQSPPPPPSPGVTAASTTKDTELYRSASAVLPFLQTACNIMLFACNIIASKGMDRRVTNPVFTMKVEDTVKDPAKKKEEESPKKNLTSPPLGMVVEQLVLSVTYHQREKANLDLLQHKKMTFSTPATSTDVTEIIMDTLRGVSGSAEAHLGALIKLEQQIDRKRQEIDLCAFLIDNCLYLIWCHLDFFMFQAGICRDQTVSSGMSGVEPSAMKISQEDVDTLKQGLISTFNDTFCKKLLEIHQETTSERGFIEALLKRIRRLIQFAAPEEQRSVTTCITSEE